MHERCFFLFLLLIWTILKTKTVIFSRLINKETLNQNKIKNTYYLQVVLFKWNSSYPSMSSPYYETNTKKTQSLISKTQFYILDLHLQFEKGQRKA